MAARAQRLEVGRVVGVAALVEWCAVVDVEPVASAAALAAVAIAGLTSSRSFLNRAELRARRCGQGRLAPPKSRYGRRDVPLSPRMAHRLWEVRKGRRPTDADPIFSSRAGTPFDPSNLSRMFKAAARRAGVPWASFHTLRHTCATILFRRGLNAKQVQVWLGHHSPAFTLATYVHLLADDLPEPSFLDEVFNGGDLSWEPIAVRRQPAAAS